jgi:hypothetical protein
MIPTPPFPPFDRIPVVILSIDSIDNSQWKYTFQHEESIIHLNFDEDLNLIGQSVILIHNNGNYEMEY